MFLVGDMVRIKRLGDYREGMLDEDMDNEELYELSFEVLFADENCVQVSLPYAGEWWIRHNEVYPATVIRVGGE